MSQRLVRAEGEGGALPGRSTTRARPLPPPPPGHSPQNSIQTSLPELILQTMEASETSEPSQASKMFKAHSDKMEERNRRRLSQIRAHTENRKNTRLRLFPGKPKSDTKQNNNIQRNFRLAFQESLAEVQRTRDRVKNKQNACCLVASDEYSNFSAAAMQPLVRSRKMNQRLVEINQELFSKLSRREQQLREAAVHRQQLYARITELESQMGCATNMLDVPIQLLQQQTEKLSLEPTGVSPITMEESSVPLAHWTEVPDLVKTEKEYVEYGFDPKQEMKFKKEEMKYH